MTPPLAPDSRLRRRRRPSGRTSRPESCSPWLAGAGALGPAPFPPLGPLPLKVTLVCLKGGFGFFARLQPRTPSVPPHPHPHPSPPRGFAVPRHPPAPADTPRLHLISPRLPCRWQQRVAHGFIYAHDVPVIAPDPGARRRAPATGFSLRAAGGRRQGPATPPSSRRSDSRIRGPKGASALTNRSGAVGLRDPATRCPRVNQRRSAFGGVEGEGMGRNNQQNATFRLFTLPPAVSSPRPVT